MSSSVRHSSVNLIIDLVCQKPHVPANLSHAPTFKVRPSRLELMPDSVRMASICNILMGIKRVVNCDILRNNR
ncbi:hypothetical protein BDZ91DRAFT_726890 [Kalaharituber pfeilii]|nr:hypothetical protein BDZ91DRAFT_726890 [Kalaharituber pfeilii]